MSSKRKFYKTYITITILSEDVVPENVSLERIESEIESGDWVGDISIAQIERLDAEECAHQLVHEFGSDPEFFMLDEDGNDV